MVTVLALDFSDGWVFGKEDDRILLMRPPYRLAEAQTVSEAVVARAVTQHGYVAVAIQQPSWADAIKFVRSEVARKRKADGRPLPEEGVGRAMLRKAPATIIERFLARIRTELLPSGELAAAEGILEAIQIESLRVQESPELAKRTAELTAEVRKRVEERRRVLTQDDSKFARLKRADRLTSVLKYGQRVALNGSMFAGR